MRLVAGNEETGAMDPLRRTGRGQRPMAVMPREALCSIDHACELITFRAGEEMLLREFCTVAFRYPR